MWSGFFVLEVLKFVSEREGRYNKTLEHIGYMNMKFKTKKECISYYDEHNPHMRSLNAHETYMSDWDPNTTLVYIVRDDYSIMATIPPFVKKTSFVLTKF